MSFEAAVRPSRNVHHSLLAGASKHPERGKGPDTRRPPDRASVLWAASSTSYRTAPRRGAGAGNQKMLKVWIIIKMHGNSLVR